MIKKGLQCARIFSYIFAGTTGYFFRKLLYLSVNFMREIWCYEWTSAWTFKSNRVANKKKH